MNTFDFWMDKQKAEFVWGLYVFGGIIVIAIGLFGFLWAADKATRLWTRIRAKFSKKKVP